MLKRLFRKPPRALPKDIAAGIAAICRPAQIDTLSLSPHLCRDLGLDCGCRPTAPPR